MKIEEERVTTIVRELVGDDAVDAVVYLRGKQNVSEFIVAEDLNLEIHETRNILYRCFDHNILTFVRKKDKKKGWYICYWNLNEEIVPHLEKKIASERLGKLKARLAREKSSQFFMCGNTCTRMDFERSVEYDFHCPECNEVMQQQDNSRTIEVLAGRIAELEAEE